jgi:tRNA1(Val) A37 N6-methylase TrmN6
VYKDAVGSLSNLQKSHKLMMKDLEVKNVELDKSQATQASMDKKYSKIKKSLTYTRNDLKELCGSSEDQSKEMERMT